MQLTPPKNLKLLLTSATCALLGTPDSQASESLLEDWQFDTALMYYDESDRVTAVEAIIAGTKTFANDEVLSLKVTIDSLTGASANGAVQQESIQTFTRPSGNGQYQTKPNNTPLDDTFKDTRLQLTGQWTQPWSESITVSGGGNISKEYDYLSLGVNANVAKDFNKKNTTVSFGTSFAYDMIEPEGGIPVPFSTMAIESFGLDEFDDLFDATRHGSDDDKTIVDALLGVTQVINRRLITQFNYSYSNASGYMTDPFKVISVVDYSGNTNHVVYEHRPDNRTKHAFFGQAKYHFETSIIDFSYRYMTDDWEIDSHTIDIKYHYPISNGHYIQPHLRLYTQTAAEFYQPFIVQDENSSKYASADYRIGELNAYTLGVKYGMPLANKRTFSFRVEYYHQSPQSDGTPTFGALNNVDLYEEVDAVIAQVNYSF